MPIRLLAGTVLVTLGIGLSDPARAQYLQPGMRTMIQQGGIEPGPLLGAVLPGYGYAPYFGFVPDRDLAVPDERVSAHEALRPQRGHNFNRDGARRLSRVDGHARSRATAAGYAARHRFAR